MWWTVAKEAVAKLVSSQGRPSRSGTGILLGVFAWTDHSDCDCRSGPLLWTGCSDNTGDVIEKGCWAAPARRRMLASASRPVTGALATVLGIGALLFAAIGVVQLKARSTSSGKSRSPRRVGCGTSLAITCCRLPLSSGTCFSSPGFAPRNDGFGCRRRIRLSLHARSDSAPRQPSSVVCCHGGLIRDDV